MDAAARTRWVVEQARALGFDLCGVATAEAFPELAHLPEWRARGYAGEMRYLHDPRRAAPGAAWPGARSVVVCAMNYNTPWPYSVEARASFQSTTTEEAEKPRGWISRYAWGDDYHEVLGGRLEALTAAMRAQFRPAPSGPDNAPPFDARWYVDTGPIVERVAAKYAGLGWLGKNTCLINRELGSWLFLGVILATLEMEPSLALEVKSGELGAGSSGRRESAQSARSVDSAHRARDTEPGALPASHSSLVTSHSVPPDLCGQCTLCLEACPTGALVEPYVLDARRCISYLTIELRGPIPAEFQGALGWHVFGCDICQDVCPYNARSPRTTRAEFMPRRIESADGADSADGRAVGSAELGVGRNVQPVASDQWPGASNGQLEPQVTSHPSPVTESEPLPTPHSSLFTPGLYWLSSLSEEQFRSAFAHSAVRRTKHAGLVRNARAAQAQTPPNSRQSRRSHH